MMDSYLQINKNSILQSLDQNKYDIFYLLLLTLICTIIIYISLHFSIFYSILTTMIVLIIAFYIIQNYYKNIFNQNHLFMKTKVTKINQFLENTFY